MIVNWAIRSSLAVEGFGSEIAASPFYISSDTRQPAEPRARDRIAVRIASRSVGRKSVVRLVKPSSCTRKAERIVPRIFTRSARGPRTSTRRAPGVAPFVESGAPSHFRLPIQ